MTNIKRCNMLESLMTKARKKRLEQGISMYSIAKIMNISQNQIANWENNKTTPGADMLVQYLEIIKFKH